MPNENELEPIGGPEPVTPEQAPGLFGSVLSGIAIIATGILSVAIFATPTSCRGATRSTKLKWQQRDREIQQAIQSSDADCQSRVLEKSQAAPLENGREHP